MPYIKQDDREHYDPAINLLMTRLAQRAYRAGDLTYIIYKLLWRTAKAPHSYANLSRVRASAQDAADEFYRSVMADYEDKKIEENGDITC